MLPVVVQSVARHLGRTFDAVGRPHVAGSGTGAGPHLVSTWEPVVQSHKDSAMSSCCGKVKNYDNQKNRVQQG